MFKFVVIFIVIFVSQCDTKCKEKHELVQCDSVYDIRKLKEKEYWTHIDIRSTEKERINSNIFAKTPYVRTIRFWNAVKEIEDITFYDLSSLNELEFSNCNLPIIKKNWFSDLSSIEYLTIYSSNVNSLEPRCFEGTPNLTQVAMMKNNISHIPGNVFSDTSIRYLVLPYNDIQFIQENAFVNMSRLVFISLNNNLLKSFIPKSIMNYGGLNNLKELHLASNKIEIIPIGAFNSLTNLTELDLACNKLTLFPESAFPFTGLPSLQKLHLGYNRMNYMPRSLILYFPNLKEIDIFGNPWQCACYRNIIKSIQHHNVSIKFANDFLNGSRPVCVVPQTGCDTCFNNIQITNDLYDYFAQDISYPCENY